MYMSKGSRNHKSEMNEPRDGAVKILRLPDELSMEGFLLVWIPGRTGVDAVPCSSRHISASGVRGGAVARDQHLTSGCTAELMVEG